MRSPYDVDGNELNAGDLDECNGITSPTPEGIYHDVLLDTPDSTSSIRCFTGVVDDALSTGVVDDALSTDAMAGMAPGPPAP